MEESREIIREIANEEYKEGFVSNVQQEFAPKGLSEDIIRLISKKKNEPDWLLDFRLKAYAKWKTMKMPTCVQEA